MKIASKQKHRELLNLIEPLIIVTTFRIYTNVIKLIDFGLCNFPFAPKESRSNKDKLKSVG